jgi:hypothetical protein
MLGHDCDLQDGLHVKRWFDAVGHYGREDALTPHAAAPPASPADGQATDAVHGG